MPGKLTNFLVLYFNWFVQIYRIASKINASLPSIKIVSQKYRHETRETIFTVQLSGKNIFPKFSATELFNNKDIFSNFDDEDRQKIRNALPNTNRSVLRRIISRTFDQKTKQCFFTIAQTGVEKVEILTAIEILEKFSQLDWFDEEDSFLIDIELEKMLN